jgi:diguanylate cyclase (GGDEF)-like protein
VASLAGLTALALLPIGLLLVVVAIWIFALWRLVSLARSRARTELARNLATDLAIDPEELAQPSESSLRTLRDQVAFDDLTGVMLRAVGVAAVEREIAVARRRESTLTVAFIDVDNLKAVNDQEGHAAGDELLRGVVQALLGRLRAQDLVFRYGGDEFVCLLPDTSLAATQAIFELRPASATRSWSFGYGLAELQGTEDARRLIARADDALTSARRPGRMEALKVLRA